MNIRKNKNKSQLNSSERFKTIHQESVVYSKKSEVIKIILFISAYLSSICLDYISRLIFCIHNNSVNVKCFSPLPDKSLPFLSFNITILVIITAKKDSPARSQVFMAAKPKVISALGKQFAEQRKYCIAAMHLRQNQRANAMQFCKKEFKSF